MSVAERYAASGPLLRVAVPSPLYRSFDYLPPEGVDAAVLKPGMRVRVPFGRTQQVGLLLALTPASEVASAALRAALAILDDEPLLPVEIMRLLHWAQSYYQHPPGEVFAAALPALLRQGEALHSAQQALWRITAAGAAALAGENLGRAHRQRTLLEYLQAHPEGVSGDRLRQDFKSWTVVARTLRDKGLIETYEAAPTTTPPAATEPPSLSAEQSAAVTAVCGALDDFNTFLLDGVTGSGKTEVYLRIVAATLAQSRQALILAPEIGLTPQLLERFKTRLPGPMAVLHSGLSDRERLNAWLQARAGVATVVIGTRSAIFTPLPRLGVIIVDEEHDLSFKQQDGFRYSARDLAVMRARQARIPVVLGSATPSLESLYNAYRERYRHLRLPERVGGAVEPLIELLDVRRQLMNEGVSAPLLDRMRAHLDRQGQVLLFLNRRGFAPTLICHECGWLCQCRRCDARMTLHLRRRRLICHHCTAEQTLYSACPDCGSIDLRALGQGTERIEQMLRQQFPDYGIARIDRDSTRRKGSLHEVLKEIHSGARRILIGTQMLAKGHHFPDVTLVGVVDADQGLFGADFRASERMAQIILQVAGRAGRAEKPGAVVIQTHHPSHPLLTTLVNDGYSAFAAATLAERRDAELPPYAYQALLRAEAVSAEPPHVFLREALALGTELAPEVELLGPAPAPMERRAGRFRAQLLAQARQRPLLHEFLARWVGRLGAFKSARKVRWSLDVDPLDLL